jgi:hypothetical protein
MFHCDRLEEAIRFLDPVIEAVRRRGAVFNFSSLSMTRAIIHCARGSLGDAEADARTALDALPHHDVWFVPFAHSWLAQVLVERGELDEASALLGKVDRLIDVTSDPFSSAPLLRARSLLAARAAITARPWMTRSSSAARWRGSGTSTRRPRIRRGVPSPRSSTTRSGKPTRRWRWCGRRSSSRAAGAHRELSADP